jgi:drug/metabolite transporter (DMT)-like permease
MNKSIIPLILITVLMTSLAQIALKAGMNSAAVSFNLNAGVPWPTLRVVFTNPMVLTGLCVYFLSALAWLVVLSKTEVSFAYPFVGLGFILTMVFAWLAYGEAVTVYRAVGTLMIAGGVALIAYR